MCTINFHIFYKHTFKISRSLQVLGGFEVLLQLCACSVQQQIVASQLINQQIGQLMAEQY